MTTSGGQENPQNGCYKAPLYLLPGEIRGPGSLSISRCSTPSPVLALAGEEVEAQPLQRARAEVRRLPVCLGPCQRVLRRLRRGEQTKGDFQMVFAGLPLCFPLEGEAATILNLGLEEPGKRNWRGGWLM